MRVVAKRFGVAVVSQELELAEDPERSTHAAIESLASDLLGTDKIGDWPEGGSADDVAKAMAAITEHIAGLGPAFGEGTAAVAYIAGEALRELERRSDRSAQQWLAEIAGGIRVD